MQEVKQVADLIHNQKERYKSHKRSFDLNKPEEVTNRSKSIVNRKKPDDILKIQSGQNLSPQAFANPPATVKNTKKISKRFKIPFSDMNDKIKKVNMTDQKSTIV